MENIKSVARKLWLSMAIGSLLSIISYSFLKSHSEHVEYQKCLDNHPNYTYYYCHALLGPPSVAPIIYTAIGLSLVVGAVYFWGLWLVKDENKRGK